LLEHTHNSVAVCIQHAYHKIIIEELVVFVNKLSVVVSGSEILALICVIREQRWI